MATDRPTTGEQPTVAGEPQASDSKPRRQPPSRNVLIMWFVLIAIVSALAAVVAAVVYSRVQQRAAQPTATQTVPATPQAQPAAPPTGDSSTRALTGPAIALVVLCVLNVVGIGLAFGISRRIATVAASSRGKPPRKR